VNPYQTESEEEGRKGFHGWVVFLLNVALLRAKADETLCACLKRPPSPLAAKKYFLFSIPIKNCKAIFYWN
jgi:hypothetical protein